jgi:Helicase HerA, central domain
MADLSLFKLDIGTFKGFAESGLEFTAEIVSPFQSDYRPNIGEFIVVSLTRETVILGRITRFFPMGVLSSWEGEEYLAEMRRRNREIPEDLKDTKLRYTVNVKLLGGIEAGKGEFLYHPSIRQLPHLGAKVGTLSDEALEFVCTLGIGERHNVPIGHYVIGEMTYDGCGGRKEVPVMFDLHRLVARRTYVFARAGYGKSNLIKLLTARLYEQEQPGGMVIFDPEGEYAFRDQRGRPGLADVPHLADKLVVYTNRRVAPPYDRWVVGRVKLNLCDLRPAEVVGQCVAEGKQETVFANVLRGLDSTQWTDVIRLLEADGYRADEQRLAQATGYKQRSRDDVVIGAIKNNLTSVVYTLHSGESDLVRSLRGHLAKGRIVVIDISLLSSANGYRVAGLILNELFHRNQENFIAGSEGDVIPTIAVLEEAQSFLPKGVSDASPFVAWVKEGRKYQLGAILVTQQPGSIAPELLSQGDNFFAFHLLSVGDLKSLQEHNAHYSNDVLAAILNEPIKGNAYLWSAPDQPFVLPARVHNFETWADQLAAGSRHKEQAIETPAEVVRRERPHRQTRFDHILMEILTKNMKVALYSVATLDSTAIPNIVAVNQWNLLFAVGEVLANEQELFVEFGRRLPDGKEIVEEEACLEGLERLGLLGGKAANDEGKNYYLIAASKLGRSPRGEGLHLRRVGTR